MNHPRRKTPRLACWDYSQQGWYFITFCTKNHRCLFGTVQTLQDEALPVSTMQLNAFGTLCRQAIVGAQKKYPAIEIPQFVIMPNHVHLLVHSTVASDTALPLLARAIGFMKSETSKGIHHVRPELSVWQRSYYDRVIRDEQDYLRIWKYIDENPRRWNLDRFYAE